MTTLAPTDPSHPSKPFLSPRIWRCPDVDFSGDEPLQALQAYTPQVLEGIRSHGFDAIWLRGRLGDLVESTVFPELNDPKAAERIDNLRQLIERGKRAGVGVYLFFNEPLSLPDDHPFWKDHADLKGALHDNTLRKRQMAALCTSTPEVRRYMREGIDQVFGGLPGLAGVLLITATEHHTHCWSHYIRFGLNDGYTEPATGPLACPRCAEREPAEVVTELVTIWRDAARQAAAAGPPEVAPRVIAWNWSWSIWYPEPQREVIDRLPDGIELMADWERGGEMSQGGRTISVDEYSMAYPGPSLRFLESRKLAGQRGLPMHAKLQIGTTHEIATVPNLPLIPSLHQKFSGLREHDVAGVMATWNFGCGLTLNSFAFGLFTEEPDKYHDADQFYAQLCRRYFGEADPRPIVAAWQGFNEAFSHYPFSIRFLYVSPLNYAPAFPLSLTYEAKPLGPSWVGHIWGDRLEDCLGPYTLDGVIDGFAAMADRWQTAARLYEQALAADGDDEHARHHFEERSCAAMIGCQLRSFLHLAQFHRWRSQVIERLGLTPPCTVPLDDTGRALLVAERDNAREALALTQADRRLGYHQEGQVHMYDAASIQTKIAAISAVLEPAS